MGNHLSLSGSGGRHSRRAHTKFERDNRGEGPEEHTKEEACDPQREWAQERQEEVKYEEYSKQKEIQNVEEGHHRGQHSQSRVRKRRGVTGRI